MMPPVQSQLRPIEELHLKWQFTPLLRIPIFKAYDVNLIRSIFKHSTKCHSTLSHGVPSTHNTRIQTFHGLYIVR